MLPLLSGSIRMGVSFIKLRLLRHHAQHIEATPTTYIALNSATGAVYVTGDVTAASQALGVTLIPIVSLF